MATRNKLLKLEEEKGDLNTVIPPLVNAGGQKLAAQELGTTQATISLWLKKNGYKPVTVYQKEPGSEAQPS